MADVMNIENLEAGRNGCDSINKVAQDVDVARQTSTTVFAALSSLNPDMGTHFNNQLTSSLSDIYNFLKNDIYETADKYYQKEDDDEADTSGNNNNNNGGYIYSGGGGTRQPDTTPETTPETTPDTTPETEPETVPDTVPITKPEVVITLKELEEIKLSELFGLVIQLVGLIDPKKETLDKIFETDVADDQIKQLVLESPYVPEELKKQLTELDSKAVKEIIYNLLTGKNPEVFELNNLNKVAFYKYLEIYAMNNGITVQQLLTENGYLQLLKSAMAGLDNAVELIKGWEEQTDETFQEQLKIFYYGDVPKEFPDQDIYVSRAYVDYLATECDVSYEELLNDSSYAEVLKKGAQEFGKALSFFNSASFFDDETMSSIVGTAMKDIKIKVANDGTSTEQPSTKTPPTDIPTPTPGIDIIDVPVPDTAEDLGISI